MIQLLSKYKSYIFSFLLMVGMILSVNIFAATPERTLGFQGQFYTYNTPGNAPVNATFTFYDSLSGGNITGTPISKIIQVVNGYFGTTFTESDTIGVDLNQQLYLEVSINGTTLSPRTTVNPTVSSLKSFGTFSYAVAPSVGPSGSLYFNSTSQELYVSNGTSWQLAGVASTTIQWTPNGTSLNYMAGNVGIGTTTPSTNLEVVGDSYLGAGYPILRLTSKGTSSGGQIQFFQPESTAGTNRRNFGLVFSTYFDSQFQATSTALTFQTRTDTGGFGGTLMSLTSEGRLAIDRTGGSLSPETKFVVAAENATSSQVTLRSVRGGIVTGNVLGGINFNSNDSNLTAPGSTTASIQALANTTHTASALGTDLAFSVTNTTTVSEAMRILGNGNVGIGTSTPLTRLSISASGANGLNLTVDTSNAARSARLFLSNATSGKSGVIMNQSNDIAFNTQGTVGTDSGTERMRITELGNVGIGTSSPVDLFTVATNNVGGVGFTTQGFLSSQVQIRNSGGNGMFFQLLNSVGSSTHMFRSFGDSYLTGNFGVGTTSANTRLTITSSGANGINLDADTSTSTRSSRLFFSQGTVGQAFAMRNDTGGLVFSSLATVGTDSGTDRMKLDTNGNVGIGTMSPTNTGGSYKTLDVQGASVSQGGVLRLSTSDSSHIGRLLVSSGGMDISTLSTSTIRFLVNNVERMRLETSGNVGIGTTAPFSLLSNISVNSTNQAGLGINGSGFNWGIAGDGYSGAITNFSNNINANGLLVKGFGVASTNKLLTVNASGTDVFTVQGNGNVGVGTSSSVSKLTVAGAINSTDLLGGATTLSTDANGNIIRTPSDQKLKTNVETLTSALDKVNAMRGVSYNWIDTNRFGTSTEIGFIAQELETIVPEVVKSGGEYKSVNYQNLTALLTEAIKELSAKFDNIAEVVKTKFVDADKVKTKELCIGDTCITEQEFKQVLQNRNTSSQTPPPAPTPTPVVEETVLTPAPEEPVVETETPAPTETPQE